MPFAYDWRRSIQDAGAQLAAAVEGALRRTQQPVRLVAHSMGGLVVRSFIAQRPDLWDRLCARSGSRFVMLGTPNRGSHSMVETLLGMASTIRQLALLDVFHSQQQIVDIVARFRGALELLPHLPDGERDWFAHKVWADLRKLSKTAAAVPTATFLQEARNAISALPVEIPGADRLAYVAGIAPTTPCGIELDKHGRLLLVSTDQGDGKVTYEAGRLPGVATWYCDATHGDLANHRPAFPAIQQLLQEGATSLLSTQPPAGARGVIGKVPLLPQPALFPTEADLTAALLGARPPRRRPRSLAAFNVSVVHGDLRHARYPVMMGHYEGDTIGGAESYLDGRLDGGLSQRYALGVYPGALGTALVLLRQPNRLQAELGVPRGALIVGLGAMGELSPATLADTVRRGVLAYIAQLQEQPAAGPAADTRTVGLTVLLIGTNSASSISVDSSVGALLRGVAQASRELESAPRMTLSIGELEIVELFADVAIQATHALIALAAEVGSETDVRITAHPQLRSGKGGQVRILPGSAANQWRRWIITAGARQASGASSAAAAPLPTALAQHLRQSLVNAQLDPAATAALARMALGVESMRESAGELTYVALSDRARAEVRVQQSQPELIDRLVAISIRDTQFQLQTAHTLFELLIPNELKDTLAQQPRLVLVVDHVTAAYPWELMAVGSSPVCVEAGLVRQLQTAQYRPQIRATTANTAFVVGDPLTSEGVPPLPAAAEEARAVAGVLSAQFQVTTTPERPSALEVLDGLFARPYRLVHLAGHGFYAPAAADGGRARSGMLLEGGLFLTAAEVAQMRQIPDLVFLNCCHLAQVGPEGEQQQIAYNRLAASISRELIEMGVRAVVAAGWAVRDDAASHFARVFYDSLLSGATFGLALLDARRTTWRQFPDCNTAGAYQAYGDPDFRLDPGAAPQRVNLARRPTLVAPQELVRTLSADLPASEIDALVGEVPPEWMQRADVLVAAGDAYARAAAFAQAMARYEQALTASEAPEAASLAMVEDLANVEARWGERTGDADRIQHAIERLENLLRVARTPQRLALLGSAHKRLAQVVPGTRSVQAALRSASRYYHEAATEALSRGELEPYFVINWLTVDALLERPPKDAAGWLARARAAGRERFAQTRAVWDVFCLPDVELLTALLQGTLAQEGAAEALSALYRAAADEAGASAIELDSALSQLRFVEQIARSLGDPLHLAQAAAVSKVRALVEAPAAAAPPVPAARKVTAKRKASARRKPPVAGKRRRTRRKAPK
jgi:CHAT domain-containing protein